MRIELVAHNPTKAISGIGRYTRELYQHLQQHGELDVRLTTNLTPPLSRNLTFLQHFPLGVKDHQPGTIVHFTQIMGCAQMLWHPVHPAIATVHDLGILVCEEDKQLFNSFDKMILLLQFQGLKHMDQYLVHSEYTKHGLIEKLNVPSRRITVIPSSVDVQHFRPIEDAKTLITLKYGIPFEPNVFYMIYVGSELPRKNIIGLLQSIHRLKNKGYNLKLIKIGSPGGEKWRQITLQMLEKFNLQEQIIFPGVVPDEDLPTFYNAVELCVTPTLLEGGFAWLAMEGMACKKPVIATRAAHIPVEASEAVIVVEPGDVDGLANAIERCLNDSGLRERMAERGYQLIQRYTWANEIEHVFKAYQIA